VNKSAGMSGGPGRRATAPVWNAPATVAAAPIAGEPSDKNATGLALQEGQKQFYGYRNDAPAPKTDEPLYFKPGEAAPAPAKPELRAELAKADEKLLKDAKANEFRERKLQQNAAPQEKGGAQGGGKEQSQTDSQQPPQQFQRKIIRTGEVEYEIES